MTASKFALAGLEFAFGTSSAYGCSPNLDAGLNVCVFKSGAASCSAATNAFNAANAASGITRTFTRVAYGGACMGTGTDIGPAETLEFSQGYGVWLARCSPTAKLNSREYVSIPDPSIHTQQCPLPEPDTLSITGKGRAGKEQSLKMGWKSLEHLVYKRARKGDPVATKFSPIRIQRLQKI